MNIVTIIDQNWLDNELVRFVNYAGRAMPKTYTTPSHNITIEMNKYYLVVVYANKDHLKKLKKNPILAFFEKVSWVKKDPEKPGYLQYNILRFSLLKRFKLDECLYTDADVDICADLSGIARESPKPLLWMKSPCAINGMGELLQLLGLNGEHTDQNPHHNAGMLYMRQDFAKEYKAAAARVVGKYEPRMIGNAAFNVMIRTMDAKLHHKAPYKYDVIWWDNKQLATALAVHYCNDQGKKKRAFLQSVNPMG